MNDAAVPIHGGGAEARGYQEALGTHKRAVCLVVPA